MVDHLVVRSKIKEVAGEFNVGSDFVEALNDKVFHLITEAISRAEANNRKTVMKKDL